MKYFDLTLASPPENLACDETLLGMVDAGREAGILRVWEPRTPFVVVGYANDVRRDVNIAACKARGIPILRRCTGGGTVVQGPGCLNYSLILNIGAQAETATIASTNSFVMERHRALLESLLGKPVQIRGHTDLAVNDVKFSGNAQRRLKNALLFHGTFLLGFDLGLIEELLPLPSRQPDYRQNRAHREFLTNTLLPACDVKKALRNAWQADDMLTDFPADEVRELALSKYASDAWNLRS